MSGIFTENPFASRAYFEMEQKTLFRNNWICAGFGHQVRKTGDIYPVEIAGLPLMLVRDQDAKVRVFHNVCRHRGFKLVEKACRKQELRCPYHGWRYDLGGELLEQRHFNGPGNHGSDRLGLFEVRSHCWADLVFIDISGEAEEFEQFINPIKHIGNQYGISDARFDETIDIEINANWKLLVENFLDGYHVACVHPELEKSVPTSTHRFRREQNLYIGEAPVQRDQLDQQGGSYIAALPEMHAIDSRARDCLTYLVLFPNLCLNFTADRFSVYWMRPVDANHSIESIHNYYANAAFEDDTRSLRQKMTDNQLAFNAEDITVLERLQNGRGSEIWDGGIPSPYWDSVSGQWLTRCAEDVR